jgi:hypothetical protein
MPRRPEPKSECGVMLSYNELMTCVKALYNIRPAQITVAAKAIDDAIRTR